MSGDQGGYILGLDLGIDSVGWAKIPVKKSEISEANVQMGVRIFKSAIEGDYQKGMEESSNLKRRTARGIRRNYWRTRRRMTKLINILKKAKLLPEGETSNPERRQDYFNQLDSDLSKEYFSDGATHQESQKILYLLRAKALNTKLNP